MRFLPLITLPHLLFLSFYIHNINLSTGRGEGVDCIIFEYRCAGFDFHHNIRAFFDLREYPPLRGYYIPSIFPTSQIGFSSPTPCKPSSRSACSNAERFLNFLWRNHGNVACLNNMPDNVLKFSHVIHLALEGSFNIANLDELTSTCPDIVPYLFCKVSLLQFVNHVLVETNP